VINGTTQGQYVQKVRSLVATMSGTTPAPSPPPSPQGDVLDLLFGGKPYDITATYGQLVTWSCPGCYDYFTAYGLDSAHHWAYDASARAGDGAPLYAPFDGKVVCAGTGIGPDAPPSRETTTMAGSRPVSARADSSCCTPTGLAR
jgi:murein DD-endopeptidase MepM/ murein hydrolase activator NlpD